VDLNKVVEQVIELTRARWSDLSQKQGIDIQMQMELAEGLPGIMGAEGEIRDALTNLLFNAVDAMPEGGTLTLRTQSIRSAPDVQLVSVVVSDDGIGMDEETRRRCLEPFFTTKGERGTGLGLAMVYGMVQRHSAEFAIDSAPGRGTSVTLTFPAYTQNFGSTVRMATPALTGPRLRILLIDDDPIIIKALEESLGADGHVTVAAGGGQAGIDAFRAALGTADTFALVITDLGMPRVDGRKVAQTVKTLSPRTPVILLTGWGQRMLADSDIPPHVDRLLSKPPRLQELRRAIKELAS
jgi:CheY-like chemotaxis protein/anti-sigma regulatory factor (Ser/Thr protein kinase)